MQCNVSSYRPHDPGHDYYAPGVYLITLVVRNRERNHELLGRLNADLKVPAVELTEVGRAVEDCWAQIPEIQARHGRKVRIHAAVCMPDHFHGVIEVLEKMDRSVGEVGMRIQDRLHKGMEGDNGRATAIYGCRNGERRQ